MPVAQSTAAQQASPLSSPSSRQLSAERRTLSAVEETHDSPSQDEAPSLPVLPPPLPDTHDAEGHSEPLRPNPENQEPIQSSRQRSFTINHNVMVPYNLIALILSLIVLTRNSNFDAGKLRTWLVVFVCVSFVRLVARSILRRLSWRAMNVSYIACHVIDTAVYLAYISWFFVAIAYLVEYKDQPQIRASFLFIFIACLVALELTLFFFMLLFAGIIFFFAASPVHRRPPPGATTEELSKLSSYKFVKPQDDVENPPTEGTHVCSICLCDFEEEEVLRELPCPSGKHVFHASCVDEWLMRRVSCPICREDPLQHFREQQEDQEQNQTSVTADGNSRRGRFNMSILFTSSRPAEQELSAEHTVINVGSSS